MRIALVSDIHANRFAWSAVLKDIQKAGVDSIICLGDVVGYGPSPIEVLDSVYEHADHFCLGNHDAVIGGVLDSDCFYEQAQQVIEWTRSQLGDEAAAFFRDEVPMMIADEDVLFSHAEMELPERFDYIFTEEEAVPSFNASDETFLFVGHTHQPCTMILDPDGRLQRAAATGFTAVEGYRYLVNVGSVGDPRDGDLRSSYCIFDLDRRSVQFRKVPFDYTAFRTELDSSGLLSQPHLFTVLAELDTNQISAMSALATSSAPEESLVSAPPTVTLAAPSGFLVQTDAVSGSASQTQRLSISAGERSELRQLAANRKLRSDSGDRRDPAREKKGKSKTALIAGSIMGVLLIGFVIAFATAKKPATQTNTSNGYSKSLPQPQTPVIPLNPVRITVRMESVKMVDVPVTIKPTASSDTGTVQMHVEVTDGRIAPNNGWTGDPRNAHSSLRFEWPSPVTIGAIILSELRLQTNSHETGTVVFNTGHTFPFEKLAGKGQRGTAFIFDPIQITSCTISYTAGKPDTNITGFTEVEFLSKLTVLNAIPVKSPVPVQPTPTPTPPPTPTIVATPQKARLVACYNFQQNLESLPPGPHATSYAGEISYIKRTSKNHAGVFDGKSGLRGLPSFNGDTYSVSLRMKGDGPSHGTSGSSQTLIHISNTFKIQSSQPDHRRTTLSVNTPAGKKVVTFGELERDTWYHLAATSDGNTFRTYTDGQLISTKKIDVKKRAPADQTPVFIGINKAKKNLFFGALDDVRIYTGVLSPEEILEMNTSNKEPVAAETAADAPSAPTAKPIDPREASALRWLTQKLDRDGVPVTNMTKIPLMIEDVSAMNINVYKLSLLRKHISEYQQKLRGTQVGIDYEPLFQALLAGNSNASGKAAKTYQPGLVARYYPNTAFAGKPKHIQPETEINHSWGNSAPYKGGPKDNFSVEWVGFIKVPADDSYKFHTTADDTLSIRLKGNNQIIKPSKSTNSSGVGLKSNTYIPIRVRYQEYAAGAHAKIEWSSSKIKKQLPAADRFWHTTDQTSPDYKSTPTK